MDNLPPIIAPPPMRKQTWDRVAKIIFSTISVLFLSFCFAFCRELLKSGYYDEDLSLTAKEARFKKTLACWGLEIPVSRIDHYILNDHRANHGVMQYFKTKISRDQADAIFSNPYFKDFRECDSSYLPIYPLKELEWWQAPTNRPCRSLEISGFSYVDYLKITLFEMDDSFLLYIHAGGGFDQPIHWIGRFDQNGKLRY